VDQATGETIPIPNYPTQPASAAFDEMADALAVPRELGWIWAAAMGTAGFPVRNLAPARNVHDWKDKRTIRRDRKPP
jgi:hypothetical protein